MKIHQLYKSLSVCAASLVMTSAMAGNSLNQFKAEREPELTQKPSLAQPTIVTSTTTSRVSQPPSVQRVVTPPVRGVISPILEPIYTLDPVSLPVAQLQLPSFNDNRQRVQYSRAVSTEKGLLKRSMPATEISQEYWFNASGSQLKKGVAIDISGNESLIRISPKAGFKGIVQSLANSKTNAANIAIDLDQLEITSPNGNVLNSDSAMSFKANSKQLSSTGFAKGTSAFKLDQSMPTGRFQVKTSQSLPDNQEYLVSVLEKNSPYQLNMQLANQQIIAGDKLSAKISMNNGSKKITLNKTQAKFVSPDGQVYPTRLAADKRGNLVLQQALKFPFASSEGLWELQITTQGTQNNQTIKRNSKLAFAYQPKTAQISRLSNRVVSAKSGLTYSVNVNTNYSGRYEVTGLLYVVNATGSRKVIAQARTAQWVEPGNENISLLFQSSLLPKLKRGQRFEVSQIGLNDQSRMSALQ